MYQNLSINDYRFIFFNKGLKVHPNKRILFADIADVFFWGDPFGYMTQHSEHNLFF